MSLQQSIIDAREEARRQRAIDKLSVLQLILSELKNERINTGIELTDEITTQVLLRQVKRLKDALSDFEKGRREDLITKTKFEIDILNSFLPKQLSDEELEKIVEKIIFEIKPSGPADLGKLMGKIMLEVKGLADGSRVREIAMKKIGIAK